MRNRMALQADGEHIADYGYRDHRVDRRAAERPVGPDFDMNPNTN